MPSGSASSSGYQELVARDGAVHFWRLGEVSGTLASDWAGDSDLTLKSSQRNVGGAIVGDPDPSTTFSAGSKTGGAAQFGPQSFSAEAWFKTTTRSGGKIIGFGSVNTNNSSSSDRHVYMSNSGQLSFGANANGLPYGDQSDVVQRRKVASRCRCPGVHRDATVCRRWRR